MKKAYLFCFLSVLAFGVFSFAFGMMGSGQGMGGAQGTGGSQSGQEGASNDILSQLPVPQISISAGERISGQRKIEIRIPEFPGIEIEKVEIYLRQPSSLTEIYVGTAKKKDGVFEFDFNSEQFPNSQYFLFLKISSSLGEYKGQEIPFEIENKVEEKKEEKEKIKEEVGPKMESLKETEEKAEKIVEETKSEIEKEVAKAMPEVKEEVKEKTKEIEPKIKEMKEKMEKEAEIKEEAKTPQIQREKENLKKEIVKKSLEPIEKKITALSPEEKERAEMAKSEVQKKIEEILEKTETQFKEIAKEKKEIYPQAFKDSDQDGISDWQEIILETDPLNPDTDGDGYLDGIEYKLGFDPKKPGPADKILWQDPREKGKVGERVVIERVEIVDKKLKITGRGIPNSFVTIYIFSKPIVALAKVNENGFFEYVLDKELTDGTHTVYVALTNNKGEIEEKSGPFTFVQTQGKILKITEIPGSQVAAPPSEALKRSFLILVLGLIVLSLGIGFFVMGLAIQRKRV
jgi:DNA polymerase III alpha subunit (gram-positive type)